MTDISASTPMAKLAHEMPKSISDFIASVIEKREDVVLGPFDLFIRLQKEAPEELDSLPRVGSKYSDRDEQGHAPNNPETYQAWDREKQTNVEHNAFTDYFNATPIGVKWTETVAQIKAAQKGEADGAGEYKAHAHDANYLKDELNLFNQRLSRGRSLVRSAARIRDVLMDLSQYDTISVRYNTYVDGQGNVKQKRSHYPFRLCDAADASVFKPLSISDLLKYNKETIARAVANGGTHPAFVAAIARQKPEPKEGKVKIKIDNIEQLESYIAGVTNYLDLRSKDGRDHEAALRTLLTAKRAENESLIEQIGLLYHSLGSLYSIVEPAYNRIVDKKAAANAA